MGCQSVRVGYVIQSVRVGWSECGDKHTGRVGMWLWLVVIVTHGVENDGVELYVPEGHAPMQTL